jgi:2-amino-4-hydroxy-6-hydroxymethyldihydropteridine diphosphokinase
MHSAYLLTGSNIGNSLEHLTRACRLIDERAGHVAALSSVYKTAPWGNTEQQDFLNQVMLVETPLEPLVLLETVLQIEQEMGRHRKLKWGPRIIDIDILFYDHLILDTPALRLPHPFLHLRRFTLMPLNEIAPGLVHPVSGNTVEALLEQCEDLGPVEKM